MIKVEMKRMEKEGKIAFAFECSNESDLETLDDLAEALMGEYKKEGGFVHARRFVMHVFDPLLKNPPPEPVAKIKTVAGR